MLRLDMTREPAWLDLGHGVRVEVEPLTTALMVAARSDPEIAALPEAISDEALALAMAKAVARPAMRAWEGVGDAEGAPLALSREGIDALLDIWPLFEAFQLRYVARGLALEQEKTPPRPRRMALRRGARYCEGCEPSEGCEPTEGREPSDAGRKRCADCPAVMNQPSSVEGWQVWDLAARMGGQLRAIPGAVLGWDLAAGLALADALGVCPVAAAELLPEIEAVAIAKLNAQMASDSANRLDP